MAAVEKRREFDDLDPNLPTIAALAAAEIDAVLRKKNTDLVHLQRLANVLLQSVSDSGLDDSSKTIHRLLDPVASGVISKAVTHSESSRPKSYEDVIRISAEIVKQMQSVEDASDPYLLGKIKTFCLAISRYSLASRERPSQKSAFKYRRAYS